jgi:hypothetical protein
LLGRFAGFARSTTGMVPIKEKRKKGVSVKKGRG